MPKKSSSKNKPKRSSLVERFKELSAGERAAVIGGFFVVVAAAIQIVPAIMSMGPPSDSIDTENLHLPDIEMCSSKLVENSGERITDNHNNFASPPYIDITLLNKGNGTGVITQLDLEVINSSLNLTPVLDFYRFTNETKHIFCANIANSGWGPAALEYNASFDFGANTSLAGIDKGYFNWTGDINPGEDLYLKFKYNPQKDYYLVFKLDRPDDIVCDGIVSEYIKYSDRYNKISQQRLNNTIYLCKINRSSNRWTASCFDNKISFIATVIKPVEILHADSLDPEKESPYNISFNIVHYLGENEVDRIIIALESLKSGKFQSRVRVQYNSGKTVSSQIMDINLIKCNNDYLDNIRRIDI